MTTEIDPVAAHEALALSVWLSAAAYLAWSLAQTLSLHLTKYSLTPFAAARAPPWLVALVALVLLAARAHHRTLRRMRLLGTRPAPKFPHSDPVLGLGCARLVMRGLRSYNLLETWHRLFTQSIASTYWVRFMGKWLLMTCEADNVKSILATDFDAWVIGGVRLRSVALVLTPHSIFTSNGAAWAEARALIRPSFKRNQIADLKCTERHVENLLARLPPSPKGQKGEPVDLQDLFSMFTMDTSTDFMFDRSTNTLGSPSEDALEFAKAFDYALEHSTNRARTGWIWAPSFDKRFDEAVARCRSFIDQHVAAALAQGKAKERPYVFMNELIESGASREQITGQLLAMIVGGRDTSASLLSSLFWVLARRDDVVQRLRLELAGLEGRRPSWEELRALKYLNNVIKEALRLWPPVPSNSRVANRDTILPKGGGRDGNSPLFVPKGVECRFSNYSLHRRVDIYGEDANEFRPERWDTLRVTWGYVPFSGGPRVCIGQQFALTMMSYVLARLFQVYEKVEAHGDGPMQHRMSATVSLVGGCWVRLTPASDGGGEPQAIAA